MMGGMFSFIYDVDNYEDRRVGRTVVAGLVVSTCDTSDEGYETALLDANGVHPVERYSDKTAAIRGHEFWEEKAKTITTVVKLGWLDGLVNDEEIVLVRMSEDELLKLA